MTGGDDYRWKKVRSASLTVVYVAMEAKLCHSPSSLLDSLSPLVTGSTCTVLFLRLKMLLNDLCIHCSLGDFIFGIY